MYLTLGLLPECATLSELCITAEVVMVYYISKLRSRSNLKIVSMETVYIMLFHVILETKHLSYFTWMLLLQLGCIDEILKVFYL